MWFLAVVLVALPPEPRLSDRDDFNAMVATAERDSKCDAYLVERTDEDDVRIVRFMCPDGVPMTAIFVLRDRGDWLLFPRQFRSGTKISSEAI